MSPNRLILEALMILFKLPGNIIIHLVKDKRAVARSIVYNYVLQNQKTRWLKRLWERKPLWDGNGWNLKDVHGVGESGYVGYIGKVRPWEFYKTVWLVWGWLDDDSNEDTTDKGHCQRTVEGAYPFELGRFFKKELADIDWSEVPFGCAFDLGDKRAASAFENVFATATWTWRNTSMNFKYLWMDY